MSKSGLPIKLKELNKMIAQLCSISDFSSIVLSSHFRKRMKERKIELTELYNVLQGGRIKPLPPEGHQAPDWRWMKVYRNVTLVFKINLDRLPPTILFITCWRGNQPAGEIL